MKARPRRGELPKKNQPFNMMLFNGAGALIAVTVAGYFVKTLAFPERAATCSAMYGSSTQFPLERASGGYLSPEELQARLNGRDIGVLEFAKVVPSDGTKKLPVLEVSLPKGSINPNHPTAARGGVDFQWQARTLTNANAACLSYAVWLPANFDYKKGGTLPGLFGSGNDEGKGGFSTRYMWRESGESEIFAVLPAPGDTREGRGQSIERGAFKLPRGKWVSLEQEIVLNTPGKRDGELRVWVDGEIKIEKSDVFFRQSKDVGIAGVLVNVFYGGLDLGFGAPADTRIRLSPFDVRVKQ